MSVNWKVHAVSFVIFLFAVGTLKLVWDNPKVILYIILGGIALLAYGAVYIIVKARMDGRSNQRGK